ncbi:hypothetical protein BKK51_10120 [Rodentibacter trehalosifermentans]|uniref:Uncharacterized protein n=1 Tax=Rodentibacter trehalosifermentans TaxID=1908263 RepID=A0A1V3IP90_9PAST|nr:hypothetical protein [Rodentibacter trehalosifermentans]OOF44013.1 hypothetical protein BKK51_10120 [Rodentibacter trehalosifermentans]
MKREIRGITLFSVLWDMFILGGFIYANEFAITNLIKAYEWFFYFMSTLWVLWFFLCHPKKPTFQYTKGKLYWEFVTSTLLGIMLAYYGYFVCATILTFFGYANAGLNYFEEKEHGKTF